MPQVNSHKFHRLFEIAGRPAYVKEAAVLDIDDCPATAFADVHNRKYPCHTKEATYCSALEAAVDGVGSSVARALNAYTTLWQVTDDVLAGVQKLAQASRVIPVDELPDSDFALVQTDVDGHKVRKFASVDCETTVDSAIAFTATRTRLPFAWRKQAATHLLEKAAAYRANLPEYVETYLEKAAGLALPTTDSLYEALHARRSMLATREPEAMDKLGCLVDSLAADPGFRTDKAAIAEFLETLDQVDRHFKVAAHYGSALDLPEDLLVVSLRQLKTAAVPQMVRLVNGADLDLGTLDRATLAMVSDDLAEMGTEKLAAVLPTLPKPDADLLVRLSKVAAALGRPPAPKPVAAPKPAPAPVSNSLTDDNFAAATTPEALAAAAPAPKPAPSAHAGVDLPGVVLNQSTVLPTAAQQSVQQNQAQAVKARQTEMFDRQAATFMRRPGG
jgi:hypothetical protein